MSDAWKQWEGHVVDGRFPLRQFQGSTDHSAVFVTAYGSIQEKAALKLLPVPPSGAQAFLRRWELASTLSHPHLLRLFAWGICNLSDTQFLYVVCEFADESLAQILPNRTLTAQETEFMLRSTLEVLGYLHGAGYVHAGLKPANLMAVGDDLKLSSESICTPRDRGTARHLPGPYDAPELAATGPTSASDIWALGVTLVEALTQKVSPGTASREGDQVLPDTTPGTLLEITRQCLRLDPDRRWTTQEIAARLLPSPEAMKSKSSYVPVIVAVVALGMILAAGKVLWHQPPPKGSPNSYSMNSGPSGGAPVAPSDPGEPMARPAAVQPRQPVSMPPSDAVSPPAKAAIPLKPDAGAVLEKAVPRVSQRSLDTITGKIRVSVKLAVDASGKVTGTSLASAGPSHYFARIASDAARGWKFTPPVKNNERMASEWMLRFVFTRAGVEVQPVQLSP